LRWEASAEEKQALRRIQARAGERGWSRRRLVLRPLASPDPTRACRSLAVGCVSVCVCVCVWVCVCVCERERERERWGRWGGVMYIHTRFLSLPLSLSLSLSFSLSLSLSHVGISRSNTAHTHACIYWVYI